MKNLAIISCFILLFSCGKLIEPIPASKLGKIEKELAITSFISPQDSVVWAFVDITTPIFQEYPKDQLVDVIVGGTNYGQIKQSIQNAEVVLSNKGQELTLEFNPETFRYEAIQDTSNPFVREGETYLLTVKSGELEAHAQTTVPTNVPDFDISEPDFEIKYSRVSGSGPNGPINDSTQNVTVQFDMNWSDDSNQNRYYLPGAYLLLADSVFDWRSQSVVYQEKAVGNIYPLLDNESVKKEFTQFRSLYYSPGIQFRPDRTIITGTLNNVLLKEMAVQLYLIDENMYQWEISKRNAGQDNPFAEPNRLFSNVENGLGVFCSASSKTKIIALNKRFD